MATIKKACKGTLYPKSSSVSKRLKTGGGFPDLNKDGKLSKADVLVGRGVIKAKKGMKVKKAQDGDKFNYKLPKPMVGKVSADTTGYSAGKKKFPATVTSPSGSTKSGNVPRRIIKSEIEKMPKQKKGGMTKKCAYGCK